MIQNLRNKVGLLFAVSLVMLLPDSVFAKDGSCLIPDKAINIYAVKVCPDKHNKDDNFVRWMDMVERLDSILPGATANEAKTAEQVCSHVKTMMDKYSASSERYVFMLQAGLLSAMQSNPKIAAFVKPFQAHENSLKTDAPADLVILKILESDDPSVLQKLLSFYPEENQKQILMVQEFLDRAKHLATLYDSTLDSCPDYAKKNEYYKVLNYNGPDAGYDYTKDKGWDALREKWARNKELGIVE